MKFLWVTILQGVEFPIFPIHFAWALQQQRYCAACEHCLYCLPVDSTNRLWVPSRAEAPEGIQSCRPARRYGKWKQAIRTKSPYGQKSKNAISLIKENTCKKVLLNLTRAQLLLRWRRNVNYATSCYWTLTDIDAISHCLQVIAQYKWNFCFRVEVPLF